jgi:hypothetical protein
MIMNENFHQFEQISTLSDKILLHMDKRWRLILCLICLLVLWMPTASRAAPPLQQATPSETPTLTLSPTEIPDGTPSPTLTPDETPSLTATPSATPLITPSPTVIGPTPPTLTPSPGFTATPTITLSPTPTDTLEPLPEITLLFPFFTPTSTWTPSPEPAALEATQSAETAAQRPPLPADLLWVGWVILLLWLLLAGFLVAFLRYFGR